MKKPDRVGQASRLTSFICHLCTFLAAANIAIKCELKLKANFI